MPSVAMNGGMPVAGDQRAVDQPRQAADQRRQARIGTIAGRSVRNGKMARGVVGELCARLAAAIADSASTEPEDRSMPAVMMTWVTPIASRPTMDTCKQDYLQPLRVEQEALAAVQPAQRLEDQRDADQHETGCWPRLEAAGTRLPSRTTMPGAFAVMSMERFTVTSILCNPQALISAVRRQGLAGGELS